jgi:hypothetical protein
MRKLMAGSFILCAAMAVPMTVDAVAVMLPQKPGANRAALTDVIVVGRVMGMEDVDVKVPASPGAQQMTTYRIAVVTVNEVIRGKQELKQIRVGFIPNGLGGVNGPGGGPRVLPGGAPGGVPAPGAPGAVPGGAPQPKPAIQPGQAVQPAGQPAIQPAPAPAAQPAVQPAVQPAPVGQPAIQPAPGVRPALPPPGPGGLYNQVTLTAGMDGLFFLQKHPSADFYIVTGRFDFVSSQDKANYENDVKNAKRAVKLLDNPMDGLKSKEASDRYLTAALMITLYRTPRTFPNKQEAISVEESKLILQALAENDNWKGQNFKGPIKGGFSFDPMAPQQLFGMLGVTQQDGFMPPQKISSPDDYPSACRQWCQKNAGTYQIKRFVSGK